jgi:hypothetical protein
VIVYVWPALLQHGIGRVVVYEEKDCLPGPESEWVGGEEDGDPEAGGPLPWGEEDEWPET